MAKEPVVEPASLVPPVPVVEPVTTTAVVEPVTTMRGSRTCEYCGCTLDARGNVLKRGDRVKGDLEREDEIRALKRQLAELRAAKGEVETKLAAAESDLARHRNRKPFQTV